MTEFIIKYWLEFLFGLIATIFGLFGKKIVNTIKKIHKARQEAAYEELHHRIQTELVESTEDVREVAQENKDDIREIKEMVITLKQGLLSIHGRAFKDNCAHLLEDDYEISLDDYETISADHEAYNALGGNHEGDRLFNLVQKKFEKTL